MAEMLEQLQTFVDTFFEVHPSVKQLSASLQRIEEVPINQFNEEFRDILLFIQINRELFVQINDMVERHKKEVA